MFFHFGYICVSPAMAVTVAGKGSDYAMAAVDSKHRALDGSKTYKLRLPANPPVKDFWAITMYDTQTRSQLQTDQQFPTLGSQDSGLTTNADGSYDIYFAPEAPSGKEGNWLQTIPGKSWFIAFGSTVPSSPGSTRPGVPARSSWSTERCRCREVDRPRDRRGQAPCSRRSRKSPIVVHDGALALSHTAPVSTAPDMSAWVSGVPVKSAPVTSAPVNLVPRRATMRRAKRRTVSSRGSALRVRLAIQTSRRLTAIAPRPP